uniref:Uncharacterized protein n=1 Tax=Coccidioides posadasii RMSCC 3488 TaxID=454284 RepID=A0A0J6F7D9_COCPO|nr:hypothetical protein CPAG_02428 [Coccidioides posadasii RMSCC 3488]
MKNATSHTNLELGKRREGYRTDMRFSDRVVSEGTGQACSYLKALLRRDLQGMRGSSRNYRTTRFGRSLCLLPPLIPGYRDGMRESSRLDQGRYCPPRVGAFIDYMETGVNNIWNTFEPQANAHTRMLDVDCYLYFFSTFYYNLQFTDHLDIMPRAKVAWPRISNWAVGLAWCGGNRSGKRSVHGCTGVLPACSALVTYPYNLQDEQDDGRPSDSEALDLDSLFLGRVLANIAITTRLADSGRAFTSIHT